MINALFKTDYLPKEVDFVSASNGGSYDPNHFVTWDISDYIYFRDGSVARELHVTDRTINSPSIMGENIVWCQADEYDTYQVFLAEQIPFPLSLRTSGPALPERVHTIHQKSSAEHLDNAKKSAAFLLEFIGKSGKNFDLEL